MVSNMVWSAVLTLTSAPVDGVVEGAAVEGPAACSPRFGTSIFIASVSGSARLSTLRSASAWGRALFTASETRAPTGNSYTPGFLTAPATCTRRTEAGELGFDEGAAAESEVVAGGAIFAGAPLPHIDSATTTAMIATPATIHESRRRPVRASSFSRQPFLTTISGTAVYSRSSTPGAVAYATCDACSETPRETSWT